MRTAAKPTIAFLPHLGVGADKPHAKAAKRRGGIAAGVAAAAALGGLMFASPAQAAHITTHARASHPAARPAPQWTYHASCETWSDSHTFGAACSGGPYHAVAYCQTGPFFWQVTTVYGPSVSNWGWSYAYCGSVQGTLNSGDIQPG